MQATGRCCETAEPWSGSGRAFVYVMQAVQHRAHQATGRPKPRFGRAETGRAVEPLQSTTPATSTSPAPERNVCDHFGARLSPTQPCRGRPRTWPGGEADGTATVRGIRVSFGRRSERVRSEPTRWLNDRQAG